MNIRSRSLRRKMEQVISEDEPTFRGHASASRGHQFTLLAIGAEQMWTENIQCRDDCRGTSSGQWSLVVVMLVPKLKGGKKKKEKRSYFTMLLFRSCSLSSFSPAFPENLPPFPICSRGSLSS